MIDLFLWTVLALATFGWLGAFWMWLRGYRADSLRIRELKTIVPVKCGCEFRVVKLEEAVQMLQLNAITTADMADMQRKCEALENRFILAVKSVDGDRKRVSDHVNMLRAELHMLSTEVKR